MGLDSSWHCVEKVKGMRAATEWGKWIFLAGMGGGGGGGGGVLLGECPLQE